MKYDEKQFDQLLTHALKLAVQEEWSGVDLHATVPLSPSGNDKMQQLLLGKEQRSGISQLKRPTYLRRVAAAVLAALALGGVVFTNPSARAYLEKLIRTWFPDHVHYELTDEATGRTPDSFDIGYIPEGYTLQEEGISENTRCHYIYQNDEENRLTIQISTYRATSSIDNERHNHYQLVENNQVIDVYEATDSEASNIVVLYNENSNILIRVRGYLSIEELVSIICSIQ